MEKENKKRQKFKIRPSVRNSSSALLASLDLTVLLVSVAKTKALQPLLTQTVFSGACGTGWQYIHAASVARGSASELASKLLASCVAACLQTLQSALAVPSHGCLYSGI